jgi:hypothetical protein
MISSMVDEIPLSYLGAWYVVKQFWVCPRKDCSLSNVSIRNCLLVNTHALWWLTDFVKKVKFMHLLWLPLKLKQVFGIATTHEHSYT